MSLRESLPFLAALALLLVATTVADAQSAPALAGRWEGSLVARPSRGSRDLSQRQAPPRLPTVVIITTAADGTLSGTWASPCQNGITDIGKITLEGDAIHITVPNWGGEWDGKFSDDGSTLEGNWRQNGGKFPLVLKKVAAELAGQVACRAQNAGTERIR